MNQVVIKVIGNYSYQTSRCLGQGVYGKVYQGIQKQTKQKVAIKKIDLATFTNDKYLENAIFSQIYLLKRFNHPNIVKFKDVLSSKNSLYIITEFCKNGDLKQVLKKKKFKQQQAFQVIKQILNGFHQLVRERIVHRDLKPANILINDGIYKIGDFGFAKYVDNFGSQMLKSCVGSPIYMAPQILQRTPYTTKCDIWSIGVIFFQMIHNSPPWKAKDQAQLLRGIKNVSISHTLRKSTLSSKAISFLKRTLAYSQEQRIGWTQLFQNYGCKYQKNSNSNNNNTHDSTQKVKASTRQKQRVISANSSSNLSAQHSSSQNNNRLASLTPPPLQLQTTPTIINNSSTSTTSGNLISGYLSPTSGISPERKRSLFPQQQLHSNSNSNNNINTSNTNININRSDSTQNKRPNQIQNVIKWHQFLLFYHYYCVQLFINYQTVLHYLPTKPQSYGRLLFCLSQLIKNRNTFCLSMIAIHSKTHKNAQQLYKTMKIQHQSYQMTYNDIVIYLQKLSLYKQLKMELTSTVGHSQVINQDRMEKMEGFMIQSCIENIKYVIEYIRNKEKEKKASGSGGIGGGGSGGNSNNNNSNNSSNQSVPISHTQVIQILDNILQVLQFGLNRQKYNKNVQQIIEDINNQNNNMNMNNMGSMGSMGSMGNINNNSSLLMYDGRNIPKQRKISQQYKQLDKQWSDSLNRDIQGKIVLNKYQKIMSMIQNNNGTMGSMGSMGSIGGNGGK